MKYNFIKFNLGSGRGKEVNITIYDPLPATKVSTHNVIMDIFRLVLNNKDIFI